jgi:hypothetical protein
MANALITVDVMFSDILKVHDCHLCVLEPVLGRFSLRYVQSPSFLHDILGINGYGFLIGLID